jgi:hypothetical protein
VVEVNRAVAVGMADGPHAGLAILEPVLASGALTGYGPLHAAHADLLERAGRAAEASAAWARAERAMGNAALQRELHRRRDAAAGSELAGPAGKRAADHVSFGAADPVSSDADSALVFWFPAITPGSMGDFR